MASGNNNKRPHDLLSELLKEELEAVNKLIHERMTSEYAPRIPEIASHLINAGGKKLRPLLTLASAKMCGYEGQYHIHLAAIVEFIHTATLLHDDVVDESEKTAGGIIIPDTAKEKPSEGKVVAVGSEIGRASCRERV